MITLISPAKKLDLKRNNNISSLKTNIPVFNQDASELVTKLKKLKAEDLGSLMNLSENLAQLNYQRYKKFSSGKDLENLYIALYLFKGEVYNGIDTQSLTKEQIEFANDSLFILSGLYGILRPMDLIEPYRLEMGTKFANNRGDNLYDFWQQKVTDFINDIESETIINLASEEYFKAINSKTINAEIITPIFLDKKNGSYKTIMMYAKNSRGKMARYIIDNGIENYKDIENYKEDGYIFNKDLSVFDCKNKKIVFTRD